MKKITSLFLALILCFSMSATAFAASSDEVSFNDFYSALQAEYEKYGMKIEVYEQKNNIYTQDMLEAEMAYAKQLADSSKSTYEKARVEVVPGVSRAANATKLVKYTSERYEECDIGYVTIVATGYGYLNTSNNTVSSVGSISVKAVSPAKNFIGLSNKQQNHEVSSLNNQFIFATWSGDATFQTVNSVGDTVRITVKYTGADSIRLSDFA